VQPREGDVITCPDLCKKGATVEWLVESVEHVPERRGQGMDDVYAAYDVYRARLIDADGNLTSKTVEFTTGANAVSERLIRRVGKMRKTWIKA
jgi:hypothetical protein